MLVISVGTYMGKNLRHQSSAECKITTTIILALIPLEQMTRRKTARVTEISENFTVSTYAVKRLSHNRKNTNTCTFHSTLY